MSMLFRYRVKCERASRCVDMGSIGPWPWECVRDKLILSVFGCHATSKRVDYLLTFSHPTTGGDVGNEALPNKLYIVTRSPIWNSDDHLVVNYETRTISKRYQLARPIRKPSYNPGHSRGRLMGLHPLPATHSFIKKLRPTYDNDQHESDGHINIKFR